MGRGDFSRPFLNVGRGGFSLPLPNVAQVFDLPDQAVGSRSVAAGFSLRSPSPPSMGGDKGEGAHRLPQCNNTTHFNGW